MIDSESIALIFLKTSWCVCSHMKLSPCLVSLAMVLSISVCLGMWFLMKLIQPTNMQTCLTLVGGVIVSMASTIGNHLE